MTAALPQRDLQKEKLPLRANETHNHKYTEKESFLLHQKQNFPYKAPGQEPIWSAFHASDSCRHLGTRPLLLVSMASSFNTEKVSQAFKDFCIIGLHWFHNCVSSPRKRLWMLSFQGQTDGRTDVCVCVCLQKQDLPDFSKRGEASSILSITPSSFS